MLTATEEGFAYRFQAMASPCEVLIDTNDAGLATEMGHVVEAEAFRIERKYSRYRDDSALSSINRSNGSPIEVDEETAALLNYAASCFELSKGRFDVTSGVLRRAWKFDGSDRFPRLEDIAALLPLVGWRRVAWRDPVLILPQGMEIDFGGLGKEYAVDRALLKIAAATASPALVNFGGDLRVTGPRANGAPWRVAVDSVDRDGRPHAVIELSDGALTTSGDATRFLLRDGVRYSHILDPRSGWPVRNCPRSVTVAAATCMEAGILSTLAMLHGDKAGQFLKREAIRAWWVV